MTTSDYEIHLDRDEIDTLWDSESGTFPFEEDISDIEKVLEEELGTPRRRRRPQDRHYK